MLAKEINLSLIDPINAKGLLIVKKSMKENSFLFAKDVSTRVNCA